MAFTAITTVDIPVQPGTKAYNFKASGAILKGQAVVLTGDNQVGVPGDHSSRLFGVAAYSVTTAGDMVAIYGPDNIVNARISGTNAFGTFVGAYDNGFLHTSTYSGAIITKAATSTGGVGEVLLLGWTK